jgi:hypothetical protein
MSAQRASRAGRLREELGRIDMRHANPATFRQAASRFATGVAVLTAVR